MMETRVFENIHVMLSLPLATTVVLDLRVMQVRLRTHTSCTGLPPKRWQYQDSPKTLQPRQSALVVLMLSNISPSSLTMHNAAGMSPQQMAITLRSLDEQEQCQHEKGR